MVWSDCGVTSELIGPSADSSRFVIGDHAVRSVAIGPGDWFAYERHRANMSQLVVRDPDGIDRELMRRSDAKIADLAFSPDGKSIAFVLQDSKEPGIYLTSTQEFGVPNRLTDDDRDHHPFFTGSELVFTRYDRDRMPRLMRIRTDGSNERVASSRPRATIGSDWPRHRVLLVSPDLEWLYWWDPVTGRESPGPRANLSKRVQPGTASDISLSWDGRWLLYLQGNNGQEIWRQRLDDASPPELLRHLPEDITGWRGAIDPSGRAVIVTYRWSGDLWISWAAVPR
jgi:dipeptidyl aminopeptidase/acylaminoacyl peptidase